MAKHEYSAENAERIRSSYASKPIEEVFTRTESASIDPLMSPIGLVFREARDSENYPNSTPCIIGLDVTGSMGDIPKYMATQKLPSMIEVSVAHGVKDPAICFVAVGDHISDEAPLQVGQFESDEVNLNKCLTSVWIEQGGGGGYTESYFLVWLFAGKMTSIDCLEKRGKKGFLFTIGDEMTHLTLSVAAQQKIFGKGQYEEETAKGLLAQAQEKYEVFHIHCTEGSKGSSSEVKEGWKKLLGQNLLILNHRENVSDLIATTMALYEGEADLATITAGFDTKTALAVTSALAHVNGGAIVKKGASTTGIAKL